MSADGDLPDVDPYGGTAVPSTPPRAAPTAATLDIRSGGIVAVDTETLRAASARLVADADSCDRAGDLLETAGRTLLCAGVWLFSPTARARDAAARARRLAADLTEMADVYDVAELAAASDVAAVAGDAELAAALRAHALEILATHPGVLTRFAAATVQWRAETFAVLRTQYAAPLSLADPLSLFAPLLATGVIAGLGLGAVPPRTPLLGPSKPVVVEPVGAGRTTAPTSLVQIVDRIPQGSGQVRVERYTMSDGSRRFVAYVAGTRSMSLGTSAQPWDMGSNLQLYARTHSASYDAVAAALDDAGAKPGDTVDLAGHSQGAMDASFLALSGNYDVPLLVTFGDPVQASVDDSTLSVALRHLDDPVSALADGGFAAGVGADGSFVATRETPGTMLLGDGLLGPHGLDRYRETAGMLDASADPRMDAVRERFGDLAQATSVEATVYRASRDLSAAIPAPDPDLPWLDVPQGGVSASSTGGAG